MCRIDLWVKTQDLSGTCLEVLEVPKLLIAPVGPLVDVRPLLVLDGESCGCALNALVGRRVTSSPVGWNRCTSRCIVDCFRTAMFVCPRCPFCCFPILDSALDRAKWCNDVEMRAPAAWPDPRRGPSCQERHPCTLVPCLFSCHSSLAWLIVLAPLVTEKCTAPLL
jgi:hypothetical protein